MLEVAVGRDHACAIVQSALDDTVSIQCWGDNTDCQVTGGSNCVAEDLVPTIVDLSAAAALLGSTPPPPPVAVAVGDGLSCAGLDGGAVACWGRSASLGAGADNSEGPVLVHNARP